MPGLFGGWNKDMLTITADALHQDLAQNNIDKSDG